MWAEQLPNAARYVLLVWACAWVVTLCFYLAVSLKDFGHLTADAMAASAPAMLAVPATLLLASRSPGYESLGCILLAAVALQVFSTQGPERWKKKRPQPKPESANAAVLGAILVELGAAALWWRVPLLSAFCFAGGAAVWTRSAVARGAWLPRTHLPKKTMPVILAAAILISAWMLLRVDRASGAAALGRRLIGAADPPAAVPKAGKATRVFGVSRSQAVTIEKGVPGVIFRPEARSTRHADVLMPRAAELPLSESRSATIPFTGEYHLFRTSSGRLPPGAIVKTGTPLDALYRTMTGGSIETEAYQVLEAPFDLAHCAKVQVTVSNGPGGPAFASLQLTGPAGKRDLGPTLFGTGEPRETVDFEVSPNREHFLATAIRILFHSCNPEEQDRSVRIALQGFSFIGR